jgi:hypothetical protein
LSFITGPPPFPADLILKKWPLHVNKKALSDQLSAVSRKNPKEI